MRESKLAELKELANSLTIRDSTIKKSLCDIFIAIRNSSLTDAQKLTHVKQIIDECQQEVVKMVGMNTQDS
jgi:hypothetical protein